MSCIVYGSVKCDNYNDMNYLFVTITYTLITFTVPFYVLLNVAFYVLAISLSNFKLYHKNSVRVCVCTQSFSTLCNPMDCHPLGSIGFSRQDYWSGLLFLTPGDLPNPGIKSGSLMSLALAGRFFITWEPQHKD